jgi:hypothetical protein
MSAPDIAAWVAQSRLNLLRALPDHHAEPAVQVAIRRYSTHVGTAIERLAQLNGLKRSTRDRRRGGVRTMREIHHRQHATSNGLRRKRDSGVMSVQRYSIQGAT